MKFGYFDDKAKEYVITTPHYPGSIIWEVMISFH